MNKKLLGLLFSGVLVLTACGGLAERVNPERKETKETIEKAFSHIIHPPVETKEEVEEDHPEKEQIDKVIEIDDGLKQVIKTNYNYEETLTQGPFKMTISELQLAQFQPTSFMRDLYGEGDLVLVTMQVKLENVSDEDQWLVPSYGFIESNTGEIGRTNALKTDDLSGEIEAGTIKEDKFYFTFEGIAREVHEIKYILEMDHVEGHEEYDDFEFLIRF